MKRHLAVLLCYILLAGLSVYNPVLHTGTHLPGTPTEPVTDFFHFHWNYWWIRHALTTPGLNVYETNYVMAPYTSSLAYHTLTPFWFPIWAAVEPVAGTVVAMTVVFITALALAGWVFYRLLRREGVAPGLALAGGAMLMLSPMMLNGVFWTNINLMGWFWIPALALIWGRIARQNKSFTTEGTESTEKDKKKKRLFLSLPVYSSVSSVISVVSLGLAVWGMILTDLQYPLFAAFIAGPYGLLTLVQAGGRAARLRLIAWGLLAAGIALALLWFLGPLPYILDFDRSVLTSTPAGDAIPVAFPEGYVWHVDKAWFPVSLGAVLLPLLVLALILNGYARRARIGLPARRWFWLALVPAPLILSAGAAITIAGVEIPLPYRWLHGMLGGMFRYPERFAAVLLIPVVVFIMQTLTPLLAGSRGRRAIPVVLLAAVLVDARIFRPFPIQPIPTPYRFYEVMGREQYDYVIVEVPVGASSGEGLVGEPVYATTQFYGLTHGKRMVNGHLARVDPLRFWYLRTDDPLLSWLGQRRFLEPEPAGRRLEQIIREYPVGYFVIHTELILKYTGRSTVQEVLGYFNSLPGQVCPVFVEGPAVVYRTVWHPDGCPPRTPPEIAPGVYQIDVGSRGDEPYLGWGWHWQEEIVPGLSARWTGQFPQSQVYVNLPRGAYSVTLAAQSYQQARALRLEVNGTPAGEVTVSPDRLEAVTFSIPADLTGGFLTLTLDYDAPQEVAPGDRALALLVDWIQFARE